MAIQPLVASEIQKTLATQQIGRHLLCEDSISSTNDFLIQEAKLHDVNGWAVFAEEQTKGRGRLGRSWFSPKGKGLYFSFACRPQLPLADLPKITLACAVAVCDALQSFVKLEAGIKWPNDVWADGKKLSGILTETQTGKDKLPNVIVGIGINVNTAESELPSEATSLQTLTGKSWDRNAFAAAVLNAIENRYNDFVARRFESIIEAFELRSLVRGKQVKIQMLTKEITGRAEGVDENGALLVRDASNEMHRILSGDVLLCR